MTTRLIITSPHSLCEIDKSQRECDLASKNAAELLKSMADMVGIKCIYHPSTEYRKDHDLNRDTSRDTPYRKELLSTFKLNPYSILLDVHSFPNKFEKHASHCSLITASEIPPDIIILSNGKLSELQIALYDNLCLENIDCKIVSVLNVLDILNQANVFNIYGVLLEFNERLNLDHVRLYKICKIIINIIV